MKCSIHRVFETGTVNTRHISDQNNQNTAGAGGEENSQKLRHRQAIKILPVKLSIERYSSNIFSVYV